MRSSSPCFSPDRSPTTLPVRIFHYVEGSSSPLIAAVSTLLVLLAGTVVLTLDRTIGFTRISLGTSAG